VGASESARFALLQVVTPVLRRRPLSLMWWQTCDLPGAWSSTVVIRHLSDLSPSVVPGRCTRAELRGEQR